MQRAQRLAACLLAAVALATGGCALLAPPAESAGQEEAGTAAPAAAEGDEPDDTAAPGGEAGAEAAQAKEGDTAAAESADGAPVTETASSEGDAGTPETASGEEPAEAKDAEETALGNEGKDGKDEETGPKLELTLSWVSDYVFRGVSLSNGLPALQGSLDYSFPLVWGLSGNVGLWASQVRFDTEQEFAPGEAPDPIPTLNVRRENGIYGGISGDLVAGWTWAVQLYSYRYPGFKNLDYVEKGFTLTRAYTDVPGQPQVEISGATFRSVFFPGSDGKYFELNLKLALINEFTLLAHVGSSRFADHSLGGSDYVDRMITLSRPFGKFQFDLSATATNTDQFGKLGAPAVFVRVSRTF